jgi:hypothetical protein
MIYFARRPPKSFARAAAMDRCKPSMRERARIPAYPGPFSLTDCTGYRNTVGRSIPPLGWESELGVGEWA